MNFWKYQNQITRSIAGLIIVIFFNHSGPTSFLPGLDRVDIDIQSQALQAGFQQDLQILDEVPRYTVSAELLPDIMLIRAKVELEYTNRTAVPLTDLPLIIYPHMRKIYGSGSLQILSVKQNQYNLSFTLRDDREVAWINLREALPPGETITIGFSYTLKLPMLPEVGNGILGKGRGVFYLAGWLPLVAVHQDDWVLPQEISFGDGVFSETSLFELHLTIPDGYQVASTGSAEIENKNSGKTTWLVASGPTREAALAVSNRFLVTHTMLDDISISYYALPGTTTTNSPQQLINTASDALESYDSAFGPYPYSELDLVDAAVTVGGYEFPGLIFIEYGARAAKPQGDVNWLVAHEVAHQWWYGLVGNNQLEEPWLDEALATYAPLIYMETVSGQYRSQSLLNYYVSRAGSWGDYRGEFFHPVDKYHSWQEYNRSVYYQGALFIHDLREGMGDEIFFNFLRAMQAEYRYKIITTKDFLTMADANLPAGLDQFRTLWNLAGD